MKGKKRERVFVLVFFALFLVALTPVVFAQNATEDKAYACLKEKVKDKCSGLTIEEQAFSLMALAYDSGIQTECKNSLVENSKDKAGECWPSGSCKLRDTALAIIALDKIYSTDKAEDWLIKQNTTPKDLEWYLEIDTNEQSSCKISYSGRDYNLDIKSDKKLSAGAGRCFSLSNQGYWLKISDSCFNEKFEISCDKDFKTALLYKKQGSSTIYVSSKTNSEAADGKTEEQIDAVCFSQAGKCDYEGSLWAAFALSKKARNIDAFLPYLTAFSSENTKFFPEAFLYLLTRRDEYFSSVISSQKPGKYWHAENSPYTKFYDTALALSSLKDTSSGAVTDAIGYIEESQSTNGCFGSIRDTAFLLYATWPKPITSTGGAEIARCEDYNKYCMSSGDCAMADGEVLDNYVCAGSDICCSKQEKQETCSEKKGILMSECKENEECGGDQVEASDGTCCLDECVEKTVEETGCEKAGYNCRSECLGTEEATTDDCNLNDVCCKTKTVITKKGLPWFVWLLIVLIILAVMAIIFKNKLKLFLFKFKKGGKSQAGQRPQGPPPRFPPAMGRIMPRRIIPGGVARRPVPATHEDKELEETFKKLRKISE